MTSHDCHMTSTHRDQLSLNETEDTSLDLIFRDNRRVHLLRLN